MIGRDSTVRSCSSDAMPLSPSSPMCGGDRPEPAPEPAREPAAEALGVVDAPLPFLFLAELGGVLPRLRRGRRVPHTVQLDAEGSFANVHFGHVTEAAGDEAAATALGGAARLLPRRGGSVALWRSALDARHADGWLHTQGSTDTVVASCSRTAWEASVASGLQVP